MAAGWEQAVERVGEQLAEDVVKAVQASEKYAPLVEVLAEKALEALGAASTVGA